MNMLNQMLGFGQVDSEADEQVNPTPTGPVTYREPMSERRRKALDMTSFNRKASVKHRRRFFAKQSEIAVLRGQLQAIGAVPYADRNFRPTHETSVNAVEALLRRFSTVEKGRLTEVDIQNALQAATDRYLALTKES